VKNFAQKEETWVSHEAIVGTGARHVGECYRGSSKVRVFFVSLRFPFCLVFTELVHLLFRSYYFIYFFI
jgi:hypothetical protein